MLTILPNLLFSIFLIECLDNKKVELKLTLITFIHSSSFILMDKLSIFIPALLTRTSSPPNSNTTLSINSSILGCSDISNFLILISGYFFFIVSNFSDLVPVARTLAPSVINFLTSSLPIPPVAPVIKTFLFLKLIIY